MHLKEIFTNMGGQRRHWTGQLNMVEKGTLNQTMLYCGKVDCEVFISQKWLQSTAHTWKWSIPTTECNNSDNTLCSLQDLLCALLMCFTNQPSKEKMLLEFYMTNWNREQRTHRELCGQTLLHQFHPGLFLPTGLPHLTCFSSHNQLKHVEINSSGC